MPRTARLATLIACLGLLVLAPAALATSTVAVDPSMRLVNKLLVDASVTYSCPAITPLSYSSVYVSLEQAANKSIAQGSGTLTPICDGATHTDTVAIYPTVSGYTATGVPFKTGDAIASAFLNVCGPDPNNPWNQICDNASSGSAPVKINSGKS